MNISAKSYKIINVPLFRDSVIQKYLKIIKINKCISEHNILCSSSLILLNHFFIYMPLGRTRSFKMAQLYFRNFGANDIKLFLINIVIIKSNVLNYPYLIIIIV